VDIVKGAQVVIRNESNEILGTTTLGEGTVANLVEVVPGSSYTFDCNMPFRVENVPESKFYSIGIGQRSGAVFSLQDMTANNWQVVITVPDQV
jgi:hypothetical protein